MCCFPDVDTADKPPRACLDSEMVGNTQDKLLKLILGVLEAVGRAEKLVCDLFPDMECWKRLECPQPPGVTLFGKLNHFGPQAEQRLGWPLATARLNSFWPKVKPVATLAVDDFWMLDSDVPPDPGATTSSIDFNMAAYYGSCSSTIIASNLWLFI